MVATGAFVGRDVITVGDFRREEILFLLDAAERFEGVTGTLLAGRVVAALFFEPSTRTRLSFEAAVGRLGGACIGFAEAGVSSKSKGENLADTVRVVEGYSDLLLIRHPREGAARLAAEFPAIPVVNCGDGAHQLPAQTFVDLYTIRRECGRLEGLHVVFAGDLRYGRAVHSLVNVLSMFDARITLVSPGFLRLPAEHRRAMESRGVEYREAENLDLGILKKARDEVVILHPLPRVREIAPEVDAHPHAAYFRQAHYGVAVRKALLALLLGAAEKVLG